MDIENPMVLPTYNRSQQDCYFHDVEEEENLVICEECKEQLDIEDARESDIWFDQYLCGHATCKAEHEKKHSAGTESFQTVTLFNI